MMSPEWYGEGKKATDYTDYTGKSPLPALRATFPQGGQEKNVSVLVAFPLWGKVSPKRRKGV